MATAGLQVFDASGALTTDTPDAQTRYFGTLSIAAGSSGTLAVPGFSEGTPWVFLTGGGTTGRNQLPDITWTGSSLSWSYSDTNGAVAAKVMYGVFAG